MNRYAVCAAASALLSTTVMAADFELAAPAGGGVAVKNSNGVVTWKVDSAGNVVIPTLPSSLAGIPLCWNETTGVISKCPAGAVADTTPPVITTTAPAVATGYTTSFSITYADNVALAYIVRPGILVMEVAYAPGEIEFLADGVSTIQIDSSFDLTLSSANTTRTVIASDKAGNLTSKAITIALPEPGVKLGTYLTVGSYSTPSGFNCIPASFGPREYSDNTNVAGVVVGDSGRSGSILPVPYTGWSVAGGYRPTVSMRSAMGNVSGYTQASMSVYPNIPLASTAFSLDNPSLGSSFYASGTGSLDVRYAGSITKTQSSPPTINVTMTMQCNINNAGFVNGTTASFTAQMAQ